jgi:hypothetical protein
MADYLSDADSRAATEKPPSLRTMTRYLAQLGGFLARKHDGEPGTKSIWQGYQRLNDYMSAIELSRTVGYS